MKINTHFDVNRELCGRPVRIEKDYSVIELNTTQAMIVDSSGLIHGGFLFGSADYAAMLAVNHPNVVLGAADVQFLKPLKLHDVFYAEASVIARKGKKRTVSVSGRVKATEIFKGTFTCLILEEPLLTPEK